MPAMPTAKIPQPVRPSIPKAEPVHRPDIQVMLELPLYRYTDGRYAQRTVNSELTLAEATTLRQLTDGLIDAEAKLDNGVRITSPELAVRYVLQRLGKEGQSQ